MLLAGRAPQSSLCSAIVCASRLYLAVPLVKCWCGYRCPLLLSPLSPSAGLLACCCISCCFDRTAFLWQVRLCGDCSSLATIDLGVARKDSGNIFFCKTRVGTSRVFSGEDLEKAHVVDVVCIEDFVDRRDFLLGEGELGGDNSKMSAWLQGCYLYLRSMTLNAELQVNISVSLSVGCILPIRPRHLERAGSPLCF